ncbi:hypothetical protein Rs2_41312 [Raphanus sativus]|nr:hypothetical protein Rs2_41312 [Raphanus sativus]
MVSRRKFIQVTSSDDKEDFVAETRSQGHNSRRPEDDETPFEGVKPDDVKPVGEPVKVARYYPKKRWKDDDSRDGIFMDIVSHWTPLPSPILGEIVVMPDQIDNGLYPISNAFLPTNQSEKRPRSGRKSICKSRT